MRQCPWRRAQVRSAHMAVSSYGRQCGGRRGHKGPHRTPPQSKQANHGVWYNPETGETETQ
jgi:hypothetical protein